MFSISKNDVSEFLKKEKNTNEFYGSFFSFFPLPPIHLVIPSESRELGATRDLSLQRPSFSLCFSLLLLASNYSFVFKELKNVFNFQRSEEHTSELQSRPHLVCRLLLEKKKIIN